jgi:hypothetical protein
MCLCLLVVITFKRLYTLKRSIFTMAFHTKKYIELSTRIVTTIIRHQIKTTNVYYLSLTDNIKIQHNYQLSINQ